MEYFFEAQNIIFFFVKIRLGSALITQLYHTDLCNLVACQYNLVIPRRLAQICICGERI